MRNACFVWHVVNSSDGLPMSTVFNRCISVPFSHQGCFITDSNSAGSLLTVDFVDSGVVDLEFGRLLAALESHVYCAVRGTIAETLRCNNREIGRSW